MSTFNGLVAEFPDIRIDSFTTSPDRIPPLACFLSHVHSDHLAGLESLRSPFVYCSAATREILLRLERYPCRINYAQGILEARQQTFKHLHKVLKPLPLDTPACLELRPGYRIQVTLLDANHCPGAVMFLIEDNYKAILYTGDMRSEPWFVNSVARNPNLLPFTTGIKTLDKIYLDTSFIDNVQFQTKADGISQLLRDVSRYPNDTVFLVQAWTYGYEDVWVALSKFLKSQVHVDDYKMQVYNSLQARPSDNRFGPSVHHCPEAPALVGYMCGNSHHPGCLTSTDDVRIHSCEKGNMCPTALKDSVVHIQPIVALMPNGDHMLELGIGGGADDLERDARLDSTTHCDLQFLLTRMSNSGELSPEAQEKVGNFLTQVTSGNLNMTLDLSTLFQKDICIRTDLKQMIRATAEKSRAGGTSVSEQDHGSNPGSLPRKILFPYSRHSSYPELCHFLDAFKPRDIWPCTVDLERWLRDGVTIASLFGHHCSGTIFEHDAMVETKRHPATAKDDTPQSWQSSWQSSQLTEPQPSPPSCNSHSNKELREAHDTPNAHKQESRPQKRRFNEYIEAYNTEDPAESQATDKSFGSFRHSPTRRDAYHQILHNSNGDEWAHPTLISTDGNHSVADCEL